MFRHIRLPSFHPARIPTARVAAVARRSISTHREEPSKQPAFVEEQFVKPTLDVINFGKLYAKYTLFGLLALGVSVSGIYVGTHLWVEHYCLRLGSDDEAKTWEWNLENYGWTGDPTAKGTDPSLDFTVRRMIRASWMVQNWGKAYAGAKSSKIEDGRLGSDDPQLRTMDEYLKYATEHIEESSTIHRPYTISGLLFLRGTVLEKLGADYLSEAKEVYQRAWAALPAHDLHSARIAEKLGNVSSRLGDSMSALGWWARAIQLTQNKTPGDLNALPEVPQQAPASPLAQRILTDTLVSLSSHYARNGELRQAVKVEEASLRLIDSIPKPESISAVSTAHVLHNLYLLQRSSLLFVHLAEVEYVLHKTPIKSITHLMAAADASERVARALTEKQLRYSTGFDVKTSQPLPDGAQLSPSYSRSPAITKPANDLLRDSRRTVAEAWNLMGVLYEDKEGRKSTTAFKCYENAIAWGGTPSDSPNGREPAEHTLRREWDAFWRNYQRTKRALEGLESGK